jgi:hypothetical protein
MGAAVEEASTAAEADPAGDHLQRLPQDIEAVQCRQLLVQWVSTQRGRVTTIPDLAVISRAAISGMEILLRRLLLPPMANGIPLVAPPGAVDLRARKRRLRLQIAEVVSTSLARIAEPDRAAQFVAFRGRAVKCGRILPPREMLFPNLNRSPRCTIRLAVQRV